VKSCIQNSRYKIKFNSVILEEFEVTTAVRQGNALPPVFFKVVLENYYMGEPRGLDIGQGE